jgi:hypothetical protein
MAAFSKRVTNFLTLLSTTPSVLRRDVEMLKDVKKKLHCQGDLLSQGTGNQVTDQETCFAFALEEAGFKYSSVKVPPIENGFYYIYQVNGTQRSIDFQVYDWISGVKGSSINFDLKHTKSDIFFLNDGWFHNDIVYVVSWMRKTSEARKKKVVEPATFVSLGQDIPTKDEIKLYNELCEIKKKYNTEYKGSGSFHCYIRFANTYKCERFTPEYSEHCLNRCVEFVEAGKVLPLLITETGSESASEDRMSIASGGSIGSIGSSGSSDKDLKEISVLKKKVTVLQEKLMVVQKKFILLQKKMFMKKNEVGNMTSE